MTMSWRDLAIAPLVLVTLAGTPAVAQDAQDGRDAEPAHVVAFVGVHVVPMDREAVLDDQTVLVSGDRIAAIGPADAVEIPAGAERIEAAGRYLMPGLADMHVHMWREDHLDLLLANGVTTVRNMWGSPLQLQWRREIEAGTRTAPTIYTAGPLLDGPKPYWPQSTVLETPEEAVAEVRREKDAGYDGVKVYNRLAADVYEAITATAKEVGLPVWGHVPEAVGLEGVLRAGQASIEHLTGYFDATYRDDSAVDPAWQELPFQERVLKMAQVARRIERGEIGLADVFDADERERVAAETADAGTWNVPTLSVFHADAMVPDVARRAIEELAGVRYLDPSTRRRWVPEGPEWIGAEDAAALSIFQEARRDEVRALRAAGARLLLGTDTPNPLVIPGFSIHAELRELVDCGLSPYEALKAGTVDAAEFLGASDEWGAVGEGLRADLVLLEANPLQDVAAVDHPLGVMVRGRWLPQLRLQEMLDALERKYAAQDAFLEAALAGDPETAWELRETAAQAGDDPIGEDDLNGVGYALLGKGMTAAAIEVLERNTEEHPESANAWDSLGEAYAKAGRTEEAIRSYERSLELDPDNSNARDMLEKLRTAPGNG